LKSGDTLIVWKLDRLGRSLSHLLNVVSDLEGRGVGFRSLTEGMDTTTAQGKLLFSVFGALAEFERSLIRERVNAGLAAAAKRGRRGGRPPTLSAEKVEAITKALDQGASQASVCRSFGVARSTLIDSLRRAGWTRGGDRLRVGDGLKGRKPKGVTSI
jgi:DNA invertase Pin-like site-specific DNA recombinase